MALKLDAKIPAGALEEKWSNHKAAIKVVSPQINVVCFNLDTVYICCHSVIRCSKVSIDLCFQMSATDYGICRFTGQITVNSDLYSAIFSLSVDFIHDKISVIFEINIICACFDF